MDVLRRLRELRGELFCQIKVNTVVPSTPRSLLLALIVLVPIRLWVLEPHVVHGTSMWPVYADGDYVLIDKLSVRWLPLHRGDVVVLRHPTEPRALLVKRIAGLPGETVLIEGGVVSVESTGSAGRTRIAAREPVHVDGGSWRGALTSKEIFVLGDRGSASVDSRAFGSVPLRSVVGRVLLRIGRLPRFLRR